MRLFTRVAIVILASCGTSAPSGDHQGSALDGGGGLGAASADGAAPSQRHDAGANVGMPDATGGDTGTSRAGGDTGTSGAGGDTGTSGAGGDTGTGAYVRQYVQSNRCPPSTACSEQALSSSLSEAVLAGSTILVFVTEDNIFGTPAGSAPPDPISINDSANGVYVLLNTVNDQPDFQAVMSFARYDVAAGSITVNAGFVDLEWEALLVVEIANVSASPLIASAGNLSSQASLTENSVTSGTLVAGSSPALVVGFSMNCSDENGGAPTVGTGFTSVLAVWNWNGIEDTTTLPSALLEYGKFADPGNMAATFTPAPFQDVAPNDNFCTVAVALKD